VEQGTEVPVAQVYDESYEGNGKTYILDQEPIMTPRKSVFDILEEHDEFSAFRELLMGSEYLVTKHVIGTDEHGAPSQNISIFNTFRYTVYVPTNKAIKDLQDAGDLPTWEDVSKAEDDGDQELADSLSNVIDNFIKYHIQDESFFVGQDLGTAGSVQGEYETSAYKVSEEGNLSYYKLNVDVQKDGITLKDRKGKEHKVVTSGNLYNLMAREYQYDTPDAVSAGKLYTSSFIVVHQIDGALMFNK
jgi:hypothetical protein